MDRANGTVFFEMLRETFISILFCPATVPALGMETYFLKEMAGDEGANPDLDVAKIRIMNSKNQPYKVNFCSGPTKIHVCNWNNFD